MSTSQFYARAENATSHLYATYTRAITADMRALTLGTDGHTDEAEAAEVVRDAAAMDFLRAFVAMEKAMPDVFERLGGGE